LETRAAELTAFQVDPWVLQFGQLLFFGSMFLMSFAALWRDAFQRVEAFLQRLCPAHDDQVLLGVEPNESNYRFVREFMRITSAIGLTVSCGDGFSNAVETQQAEQGRDFVADFDVCCSTSTRAGAVGAVLQAFSVLLDQAASKTSFYLAGATPVPWLGISLSGALAWADHRQQSREIKSSVLCKFRDSW